MLDHTVNQDFWFQVKPMGVLFPQFPYFSTHPFPSVFPPVFSLPPNQNVLDNTEVRVVRYEVRVEVRPAALQTTTDDADGQQTPASKTLLAHWAGQ